MTELLLAQAQGDILWWIVAAIIIGAAIAILVVVLQAYGLAIPQWTWRILGILLVAFVAVAAIKILWSLW